jgi:hypothetical protein
MEEKTFWESTKAEGSELIERIKKVVHEGNVRRIIVKQGGRSVAEFPLTVGVVGTVFAPILAAIGALVALLKDCSIEVERNEQPAPAEADAAPAPPSEEPPAAPPEETPPSVQ